MPSASARSSVESSTGTRDKASDQEHNSGRKSAASADTPQREYPKSLLVYFKKELKRLEEERKEREDQIKVPRKKKNVPYVFNSLEPYRDTKAFRLAVERPDDLKHFTVQRNTASGPCDPWVSYQLDVNIEAPKPSVATNRYKRQANGANTARSTSSGGHGGQSTSRSTKSSTSRTSRQSKRAEDEDENGKRTSIYPIVKFEITNEQLLRRDLDYSDVPTIRSEVKNTYSSSAQQKIKRDYNKTRAEFKRRGLDNMHELTTTSRETLRQAYLAYLQNTPGSARAVYECVRDEDEKIEQREEEKEKKKKAHRQRNSEDSDTDSSTPPESERFESYNRRRYTTFNESKEGTDQKTQNNGRVKREKEVNQKHVIETKEKNKEKDN